MVKRNACATASALQFRCGRLSNFQPGFERVVHRWPDSLRPVAMNIDAKTAALSLHGLTFSTGTSLAHLRALRAEAFSRPIISNGSFETYSLADREAVSHLVFRNGALWQVRTSMLTAEDALGKPSERVERFRHTMHEAELKRLLGGTELRCSNGSAVELCFDERSLTSAIVTTYPTPDSRPS